MASTNDPDRNKNPGAASDREDTDDSEAMGYLQQLLAQVSLYNRREGDPAEEAAGAKVKPKQLLEHISIEGVAKYIKEHNVQNIIVLSGAGISTSAGIPDFRSPNSGLYDNLQKYNLPSPQSMFEIGFFMENPEPFFDLARELYPGKFKPTPCHYFIRMLHDKGLLRRHFTQNIDNLDRIAGLPGEKIIEAHGSFHTSHCLGACRKEYSEEWMKDKIFDKKEVVVRCEDCRALVKPDIVLFGESLPVEFFTLSQQDFPKCDLAIIMGTSLVVQPFASLIDRVPDECPRLLINLEKSGKTDPFMRMLGMGKGLNFDGDDNYRSGGGLKFQIEENAKDVAHLSTCDDGCYKLAELLGWKEELQKLVETEHKRLDEEKSKSVSSVASDSKAGSEAKFESRKDEDVKPEPSSL